MNLGLVLLLVLLDQTSSSTVSHDVQSVNAHAHMYTKVNDSDTYWTADMKLF